VVLDAQALEEKNLFLEAGLMVVMAAREET
jgi:hypothetical protein